MPEQTLTSEGTVVRPGRPSPHELRTEAAAVAERYRNRLIAAGIDPDTD